ncbi:hypothetical protein CPB85DRAFT_830139 [Mucidula mucida]|nr:hypothetical protein CPB85DRAFT_830139 [Mucidula mucida]
MDATNVELCPRCRASLALTSYTLPFEEDFARGFYNPSSTEKSSIESSLSDASADLATLAGEIQRVELLLSALKTHHARLERYIHRTTRFIQFSPIRQLPTEILGIIFASACSSCQEDEYKTPLSISLVCSKWRHIAMSTPTLWTNIYVAPYSSARGLPVYQYFLQRCGMIPISVKVEVPARNNPYQDDDGVIPFEGTYEHHLDVMGDIYASFAQWKHAEFHMKQVADILLLEDLDDRWRPQMKQSNCPILESLTLAISVYTEPFRLPRVFRDALLLSSVNFIDCRESDALLQIPGLPWENIQRVQTNQRDTASLRYMQNNRDFQDGILVLNATNQTSNYYTHSPRACPLNITTLILDRPWAYALCQFLRYVSIPTLEALTIIFRDPEVCERVMFELCAGSGHFEIEGMWRNIVQNT